MDRPTAPQLSVGDVTFDSIEIVWSFPLESPNLTVALATINGYYIYSKSHSSQWMDKQIRQKISSYTAIDLLCGTLYQFYVVAYNAMGKGDPSDAIAIKTKGSVPASPKHMTELVVANTTSALIRLDSWPSNGCPIKEFVIKYKPSKYETDWSEVSAQVWPQESLIEIQALSPGNWYLLNVKAINEAGSAEQTYQFATLTAQGGTVSPLSEREPLGLESITIVIPVICSVIVLTVILIIGLIVVNKRRLPATHNPNQSLHNQQNHCRDDQLLGSAYHLSVLDSQPPKDSHENQCFHTTVLNQKQIYFQSPYALS
ncbi:unnamed protein product, partial [Oppiella nova]